MEAQPTLQAPGLAGVPDVDANSTTAPARGRAMVANLSQKFRLPLQHTWVFWHDRQENKSQHRSHASNPTGADANYAEHLTQLQEISDVRQFWEVFNNFDVATLPMRDSVHLFKNGVKPLWEDPRNERGGAWTFRVPKDKVREFWQEVCMMAVGENLQEAVATNRLRFNDDICGLSLSVRFTSTNISIWNRDADNASGVRKLLETVLTNLSPDLKPRNDQAYYYKKHFEHRDFKATEAPRHRLDEVKFDEVESANAPKVVIDGPEEHGQNTEVPDQA